MFYFFDMLLKSTLRITEFFSHGRMNIMFQEAIIYIYIYVYIYIFATQKLHNKPAYFG